MKPTCGFPARLVGALGLSLLAGVASADNFVLLEEDEGATATPAVLTEGLPFAGANPSGPLAWRLGGTTSADDHPAAADDTAASLPAGGLTVAVDYLPIQSVPSLLEPFLPTAGLAHHGLSSAMAVYVGNAGTGSWWQPSFNYALQQGNGRAALYVSDGPLAGEIPVQSSATHVASADWELDAWRLGVYASSSDQRQSRNGASQLASRARGTGFHIGLSPSEAVSIQVDWGNDQARDVALGETTRWRSRTLSANWAPDERFAIQSSLSYAKSESGSLLPALATRSADITATYRLAGSEGGASQRLFLRLERQALAGAATELATVEASRSWGVSVGVILSTF